jgi:1-acyl-sn-glycerol-3-phosphate acyltransferase
MFFRAPFILFRIWRYGRNKDKFVQHAEAFFYIQKQVARAHKRGRVTVESYGEENLPKEDGFIMFCNHQGLVDTLVFLHDCPKPFAYLAKKEVSNVILLKQIMDALGCYSINREDIRQSMEVINNVANDVKKGKNFLIFPEGTRSKTPNRLGEFKGGSFKSATKTKCPIVPCALYDTYIPYDKKSIKPVTVKVTYLPPIYYEEYKDMKTVEIAALVKAKIEAAIAGIEQGLARGAVAAGS